MTFEVGISAYLPFISLLVFIFSLGFYWLMAFFILYHLIRFGIGIKPKQLSFIFLTGSIILSLVVTILFINLNLGVLTKPLLRN